MSKPDPTGARHDAETEELEELQREIHNAWHSNGDGAPDCDFCVDALLDEIDERAMKDKS